MRFVDINLLVYAHRPESPDHEEMRTWLEAARSASEPLALGDVVLAGFLRIVTHPRIFTEPTPLDTALSFASGLLASPATVSVIPGPGHWALVDQLARSISARGNDIPDVHLAALALEQGATFWTADRGFRRFADLDVRHPLDA